MKATIMRLKMFCNHDWKILSETITKSKYETSMTAADSIGTKAARLPWQLCDASRKHIQIFTCEKCGKLKRFVEEL